MGLLEPQHIILIFIIICIIFLVSVYIKRAIFSISKFLKYQKAQTSLLIEIAKKHQVDSSVLDYITKDLNSN